MALAATIGNFLQGWDNATIAGIRDLLRRMNLELFYSEFSENLRSYQ